MRKDLTNHIILSWIISIGFKHDQRMKLMFKITPITEL